MTPIALYYINKYILSHPEHFNPQYQSWHKNMDPFYNMDDFKRLLKWLSNPENNSDSILAKLRSLGWNTQTWTPPTL
jgi:hypothetical protein